MILQKKFQWTIALALSTSIFFTGTAQATQNHNQPTVIKILGINDFHGQVSTGRFINNRPVGSAAVLSAYLQQAQKGMEKSTVITFMGDQVGASPPTSGLLQDEPSILFLNTLANKHCKTSSYHNPKCNLVATIGNHEFDKGQQAMFELIKGSNKKPTDSWIPLSRFPGASFPHVSANIVDKTTGKTLFPPYVIKNINGIRIAFIGAILKDADTVIVPSAIKNIKFFDEADAINHYIPEIKAKGANIIIAIMHQGGTQTPHDEDTKTEPADIKGAIVDIIKRLDDGVEVVMAGHVHQFLNAYLPNKSGKQVLITEANCYSTAYADVTLHIDRNKNAVIKKSARIVTTFADQYPGTSPDLEVKKLIKLAEDKVDSTVNQQIGLLKNNLSKTTNEDGESDLGNLIADAFKSEMKSDISVENPGAIRNDLAAGKITWGNIYSVQPFSNKMVKMSFNGNEIIELLEQQWRKDSVIMLQISGFTYTYDIKKPLGNRIVSAFYNNEPLQKEKIYTVATNSFLMTGGDGFTVMLKGKLIEESASTDLDAVVNYIKTLPQPFTAVIDGRIKKIS